MVGRLEDALGLKLFDRTRSGLSLTEHGVTLQRAVASGFGQVSLAIEEMKRNQASGEIVTLSISSGFASQWLLPRLGRFHELFPATKLGLQVMAGRLYGPLDGADIGIRLRGPGSMNDKLHFCPEAILPICSPGYLEKRGPLEAPSRAGGHDFIHLEPTTFTWADFFKLTGIPNPGSENNVTYSDYGLPVQGAILGQGILLGWLLGVAPPLNSGKLVPACSQYVETGCHYVLEYRDSNPSARVRQVADWLIVEMQGELLRTQPILDSLQMVRRP